MSYDIDKCVPYDLEVYPNFFLAGFQLPTGENYLYEISDIDGVITNHAPELQEFMDYVDQSGLTLVGYNSNHYDDPVLSEVLIDPTPERGYATSYAIIELDEPVYNMARLFSSIDLMQSTKGRMSLKKLGVCLEHDKLQELPFDPHVPVTREQADVLRDYNINDLNITKKALVELNGELKLKAEMGELYNLDLISKGRATIAEQVMCAEYEKLTGRTYKELKSMVRSIISKQTSVKIDEPTWWGAFDTMFEKSENGKRLKAQADYMFNTPIRMWDGKLEAKGVFANPVFIEDRWYKMGIGGIHSIDGAGATIPAEDETLVDIDVASYYPYLILTQSLFPKHWGPEFLDVYRTIVETRIAAKRSGDKKTADILKIVINGAYGKLGSSFSPLYDPYCMINVTVRGQIALLSLVVMLEDAGIRVTSANTDGMTVLHKNADADKVKSIVSKWENITSLEMEYTEYQGVYQRDVNNYFAVKTDGSVKGKGVFSFPAEGKFDLEHTPRASILAKAVIDNITCGTEFDAAVRKGRLQDYLYTQQATGPVMCMQNGKELGKMVRFYKSSADDASPIAKLKVDGTSTQLTNSANSREVQDLPSSMPEDIDYDYYRKEAMKLAKEVSRPKIDNMNATAYLINQYHGLNPGTALRSPTARQTRANVRFCDVDFNAVDWTEFTFGVHTGGTVVAVTKDGFTDTVYITNTKWPSRSSKSSVKKSGVQIVSGSRVPFSPYDTQVVLLNELEEYVLYEYYTPGDLKKVEKVHESS